MAYQPRQSSVMQSSERSSSPRCGEGCSRTVYPRVRRNPADAEFQVHQRAGASFCGPVRDGGRERRPIGQLKRTQSFVSSTLSARASSLLELLRSTNQSCQLKAWRCSPTAAAIPARGSPIPSTASTGRDRRRAGGEVLRITYSAAQAWHNDAAPTHVVASAGVSAFVQVR